MRYRLARLHQITGQSLTDPLPEPLTSLHWWWGYAADDEVRR
ncbi:helix-turn-helix domain-containing protein [Streptomyces sp. NBC_01537]